MLHLGVDVGTTAVKAAVFDLNGNRVSVATEQAETLSLKAGWSEQNMEAVWACALRAIASAVKSAPADTIVSVGISGQGDGLWALDDEFKPVRNAILWNDQRARNIVESWIENGVSNGIAKTCRTVVWPGTSAAAYSWLKQNEPDNTARITYVCNAKDWVGYRLTGRLATDLTDATIPFLDLYERAYSAKAFELCDVSDLRNKVLPPRRSAEVLGELSQTAASECGLKAGIKVAIGALDIAAMHVGAGLNKTGEALLILGTTAVVSTVVEPALPNKEPIGATVFHPAGDRWLNVQAPQSGASALDWLAALQPGTWPGGAEDVVRSAEQSPPGANGVIFLPYLTGERAPFVAPQASGAFLGLRAVTCASDLARAVLEGVTFSLRHCIDETGIKTKTGFVIAGGGGRSPLWRQILADVLDAPVRTAGADVGPWGAALLGAGAAGYCDPYAMDMVDGSQSQHVPDETNARAYDIAYRRFREAVNSVRPLWIN